MSLRARALSLVFITNLILVATLYAVFAQNWLQTIYRYEQNAIQRDLQRVEKALERELDNLSAITGDWAIYDETYQFVQDLNPAFIETNPTPSTFANLSLNLIAIVSPDGTIAFAGFFDLEKGEFTPYPSELLQALRPGSLLLDHPNPDSEVKGLLPVNDRYLMVASRPILTSAKQGPIRGAVIFGRFLDAAIEAALAEQTQTALRLFTIEKASADPKLAAILRQMGIDPHPSAGDRPGVVSTQIVITQQALEGYLILPDLYQTPALLLTLEQPRQIYRSALQSILLSALMLLGAAVLLSLLMLRGLDHTVLRRLSQLQTTIHSITSKRDLSLRLQDNHNDELSRLADDFNAMLESLAQSKAALQQAQAELLEQAAQLTELNQTLQSEIEERKAAEHSLQAKTAQQQRLFEIAHQLSSSLHVEEVLKRIAEGARQILNADGCVIYLIQPDGKTLAPVMVIEDEFAAEVAAASLDIDSSLTGQAVLAGHGLIFNDAATHPGGFQIPGTPLEEEERVISAPMLLEGKPIGALTLDRNGRDFSVEDLRIVETFAAFAATTLKNAQLYEQLTREIEERRQVELALRQSESRYRHLVENVPIGLYRTDKDNRLLDANRTFLRLFGIPGDEVPLGMDVREFLVDPQDLERENELIDAEGVVRGYELQIRRPDGSTLWIRDTFQAVFDENGNLLYYEGSIEDIRYEKEARRIEKALFEIAQAGLLSPSLADLFGRVHQIVGELMPARNFYIALYDRKLDQLTFPYFVDQFDIPSPPQPLGNGLTDYVIRHQKPLLVDPIEFEQMVAQGEVELIGEPSLDWMGVPLIGTNGEAFGAMVVQTYDEGVRYSYGDLNVLSVISAQVALAIERKAAEEEVKRQQAFLRQIIDINPNLVFVKDRQSRYVLANQALADLYRTSVEALIGKTDADFSPKPEEVEIYLQSDQEVIRTLREKVLPAVPLTDGHGRTRWYYTVKRPLVGIFEEVHVLGVSTDITEQKLAEERLSYNAYHDALTGLPNRRLFTDRLEHLLNRTKRQDGKAWFAILFLDLDHFKNVNDTLGHVLGDQLLVLVAKRLQLALRASDTIARFGGDEFVVLLEDLATTQDATQVAERLLADLTSPFNLAGHEVSISGSIGVVLSAVEYDKPEDLLRDADIALYRAKALGRNRYVIFNTAMRTYVVQHLEMEKDLRYAIEHEQLQVYYQPIADMNTKRVIGFEALVRWRHPEKGLIQPSEFIPFAEETGLIIPMGAWVLRQACRQMRQWQLRYPSDPPLTVSVNLSNKQFAQPDLFEQVEIALRESGLPPESLQLEITESVIMENAELTIATLERLTAMGVKIHIDDFGTGYSSLAYLHLLPIQAIKIDRSFISGQSPVSNGMEIAKTIINLAHELNLDAIAEGVESETQWQALQNWRCEYAQGYLIAQVLAPDQAEQFLRHSRQP